MPTNINLNKTAIVSRPSLIETVEVKEETTEKLLSDIDKMNPVYQDVKINPNKKNYDKNEHFRVKFVSGGYGHTAAITGIITLYIYIYK